MRVVSGIAVSFDGKTSQYLSLPPLLPRRPTEWHQVPLCAGVQETDGCIADIGGGGGNLPTGRCSAVAAGLASSAGCTGSAASEVALNRTAMGQKRAHSRATALGVTSGQSGGRVANCWEALPRRAVEAVALFVSWLMVALGCYSTAMLLRRKWCRKKKRARPVTVDRIRLATVLFNRFQLGQIALASHLFNLPHGQEGLKGRGPFEVAPLFPCPLALRDPIIYCWAHV